MDRCGIQGSVQLIDISQNSFATTITTLTNRAVWYTCDLDVTVDDLEPESVLLVRQQLVTLNAHTI